MQGIAPRQGGLTPARGYMHDKENPHVRGMEDT